jgi:hypothetical protein
MSLISKMIFLFYIIPILFSCNTENDILVLKKTTIDFSNLKDGSLELDTLWIEPSKNICIVNIIKNKALGHFTMEYAIIKNNDQGSVIVYSIDKKDSTILRASKNYLSFVDAVDNKWGWFNKSKGTFIDTLPKINSILDSLRNINGNNLYYIGEANGEVFFNLNGKRIKTVNYGNCVTKFKNLDFNNLDYKLYKLDRDSLKIISDIGNDLLKEQEGVFFVPSPGYMVKNKFDKQNIFAVVDSVSKLPSSPSTLNFKSVQ